jgi:nucleoside-diphosphate-sugar epimerase
MRDYDTSESWVADITLLKSLGWKPKTEIEDGLTRMYYGNKE